MKNILAVLTIAITLVACQGGDKTKKASSLPPASGGQSEVLVVMDSIQWKGKLGQFLRDNFEAPIPNLPQPEANYDLIQISPEAFNSILRRTNNVILLMTLDLKGNSKKWLTKYFTNSTLKTIKDGTNAYYQFQNDVYAYDQKFLYLFGQDEESLLARLENNKGSLINSFNKAERSRLTKKLLAKKELVGINRLIKEKYNCNLRVPLGYQIAMQKPDFLWLRFIDRAEDKNIYLATKDYYEQEQFSDSSLVAWRNEIMKRYVYGDPEKPYSYVVTETKIPVASTITTLDGQYAKELRGLWKTMNISRGGPFISYATTDSSMAKMIYLEGLIYCPSKTKRRAVKEVEAILNTFRK